MKNSVFMKRKMGPNEKIVPLEKLEKLAVTSQTSLK